MIVSSSCFGLYMWSVCFIVVFLWAHCSALGTLMTNTHRADRDRVHELPLYGTPPAPQWSGFLDASESTPGTYLHYWFAHFEGKEDDRKKRTSLSLNTEIPVIVWFNGMLVPYLLWCSIFPSVFCMSKRMNVDGSLVLPVLTLFSLPFLKVAQVPPHYSVC